MRTPYVIGFMGYAGVGKTTISNMLKSISPTQIEVASFAGPLKKAVQELFLFSDEQVYGTKEQKETVDSRWGMSPRQVLQIVGTDCLRELIDPQFHVKRMASYLQQCKTPVVIIDDIRFADEAELVSQYGRCFSIRRPGYPKEDVRHASEYPPFQLASSYYFLNNTGSLKEVENQVLYPGSVIANLVKEKINEVYK